MMTSVGGGGYPSLPQRICGSGVHPQHDLLLVVYHHNAAVSCNLCTKPLAGLHAYNCAICMFNFHWECVFGSSSVQQPQVVPPQVGVVAANVQPPPPPRPSPVAEPEPIAPDASAPMPRNDAPPPSISALLDRLEKGTRRRS